MHSLWCQGISGIYLFSIKSTYLMEELHVEIAKGRDGGGEQLAELHLLEGGSVWREVPAGLQRVLRQTPLPHRV